MGKKGKRAGGRVTGRDHPEYLYVGRVIRDTDLGTGMVTLVVFRDADVIHIDDGDEFVTFKTAVPLFTDKPRGGLQ